MPRRPAVLVADRVLPDNVALGLLGQLASA